MKWVYNKHDYYTEPHVLLLSGCSSLINIKKIMCRDRPDIATKDDCFLVYHVKWDKVYKLLSLQNSGNRFTQATAYLEDVYTGKKYYTSSDKLEFIYKVVKRKAKTSKSLNDNNCKDQKG